MLCFVVHLLFLFAIFYRWAKNSPKICLVKTAMMNTVMPENTLASAVILALPFGKK